MKIMDRYPDEEAGQVPMAFVVRRLGSVVDESQVMDFIAKQVNLDYSSDMPSMQG